MIHLFLLNKFSIFWVILLLLFSSNFVLSAEPKPDDSIHLSEVQKQAEFLELDLERIKQDLDHEAESFKKWLVEEGNIFYVWNEKGTQHISATPPPWYRNPYYPSDVTTACVTVYKGIQVIDNSCLKSDLIDEQKMFERRQKMERYQQLKIEFEKKEQELKTLAKILKVKLGMSQKLVEMIWGKYDEGLAVEDESSETWLYQGGRWVTFRNGKVEKFQDAR